jgi:hypothetical protein
MEALRALKRRLSNIVYKTTLDDAITHAAASSRTSPGGQRKTTLTPARPALIPTPTLRTSHFPDPPRPSLEPHFLLRLDTEGGHVRMSARDSLLDACRSSSGRHGMTGQTSTFARGRVTTALMIAAGVGTVHALVSIYWAFGGSALLQTVGRDMVALFAGRRWLLLPVAAVKLAVAVAPVVLDRRSWPWRPLTRGLAWSAATVLIFWGGINTVVGNLVLGGAIEPSGGYDRPGMIGHAWLWDPLFLLWGTALAVGLAGSRRPKPLRELADRATPLDPTI